MSKISPSVDSHKSVELPNVKEVPPDGVNTKFDAGFITVGVYILKPFPIFARSLHRS
jgi:hypothetical protein